MSWKPNSFLGSSEGDWYIKDLEFRPKLSFKNFLSDTLLFIGKWFHVKLFYPSSQYRCEIKYLDWINNPGSKCLILEYNSVNSQVKTRLKFMLPLFSGKQSSYNLEENVYVSWKVDRLISINKLAVYTKTKWQLF